MDPATPTTRGRRRPRWARALLIQGRRALWRARAAAGAHRTNRNADPLPAAARSRSRPRLYAARLQLRRLGWRIPRPSAKSRAWGVAALTGTAGIVLLFLMYLAGRDATLAAAMRQDEPRSRENAESAEPARRLAFEDEPAPLFEPDLASVEIDAPPETPEPLLSLESALLRLPADSPAEFVIEGDSSEIRPIPFAALPADDWSGWAFDRARPAADPVLYADRFSPDLLQQLSAEIAASEDPAEVATADNELKVAIEKVMPEAANAGDVLSYEIVVRNEGEHELAQALVEERLPSAHQVVDVSPPGLLEGQTLRWHLRELPAGEEQRITIQVLPTEEGAAESVAAVRSSASVAASTFVRSIRLELEANVPERVHVGELCAVQFRITNAGTAPATGVFLRNDVPEPLAHALGPQLDFEVGTLAPGESRQIELPLLAAEIGTGENVAEVVADGEIRQQATGRVEVVARSLRVRRWGVPRATVGQPTVFENHVINEGEQPLSDVELVETVPDGFDVIGVPADAEYEETTRQLRWTVAALEPDATAKLPITLRPTRPGELRTILEARTADESSGPVAARVEAVPARAARVRAVVPCCR